MLLQVKISRSCIEPEGGQNLLNCRMYRPVTSPFRKVSVHSRQSEQVCRMCPLWSDRFSWKAQSGSLLLVPLHHTRDIKGFNAFSLFAYCEMWWQVQKRWHLPPPEYTDYWETRICCSTQHLLMCSAAISFKGWFLFTKLTRCDLPNAVSQFEHQK